MGLLSKIKDTVTGGGEQEIEEEWEGADEEWEDGEDEWEDDDEWEDEETEVETWDTYYQFADDALQMRGFAGCNEFVKKAMIFKINRDPANRDRIKTGRQTMQMVGDTMEIIEGISDDGEDDWETKAEKLENAARVKSAIEDFQNKEEQMVRDIMGVARDAIDTYADRAPQQVGDVDTSTKRRDEEL